MTGACRVQSADVAHTSVLVALYGQCFDDPWSTDSMAAVLVSPGAFAFLALDTHELAVTPVGFALARHAGDEVEVISIGVLPGYRRRHIAARLMEEIFARAQQAGAQRIILEVAETNEAARALYARHGFRAVGRRPDYYQRANMVPVAALTMACTVGTRTTTVGMVKGQRNLAQND